MSLLFTTKIFFRLLVQKSCWIIFNFFRWKPLNQSKIWKRKQTKALLIQFWLFIFYKTACFQKYFHGRQLSVRVFFTNGHYINNSLHLARNYDGIFVCRHYLFRVAKTELRGTDYVQGQISEHIFAPNGGYCVYYPSNFFRNARSFENWGISSENILGYKQIYASFKNIKYASFKNIKFPRGNYQTDSSET